MSAFLLAFIPLFVAIDPIGNISLFLSLTQGYSRAERGRLALQAVATAFIIGVIFATVGQAIFVVLGITTSDFRIAGGILLLILSVKEISGTTAKEPQGQPADKWVGVVPLGTPLTAGPAMITTLLILHSAHPTPLILLALAANLVIAYLLLRFADLIVEKCGEAFSRVIAKVIAIFLAAIGVMMIRQGLEGFFRS